MTDLERIELAIRRAAAQMPNGAARGFRLVADELALRIMSKHILDEYRAIQRDLD